MSMPNPEERAEILARFAERRAELLAAGATEEEIVWDAIKPRNTTDARQPKDLQKSGTIFNNSAAGILDAEDGQGLVLEG